MQYPSGKPASVVTSILLCCLLSNVLAQSPQWLWGRQGGEDEQDDMFALATDTFDNIYVAGKWVRVPSTLFGVQQNTFYNGQGGGFIAKFNPAGDLQWLKSTALGYEHLLVDAAGNIYTAGRILGSFMVQHIPVTSPSWSVFIAKFDSSGTVQWVQTAAITNGQGAVAELALDSDSNPYLLGTFSNSTITFGPHTLTRSPGSFFSTTDIYLVKYTASGDVVWAQRFGGTQTETAHALVIRGNELTIAADFWGNQQVVLGSDTFINTTVNHSDALLIRLDTSGNVLWVITSDSEVTKSASFHNVVLDRNDNMYVTGIFTDSSISFQNHILYNPRFTTGTLPEVMPFILKYSPVGNLLWAKTDSLLSTTIPFMFDAVDTAFYAIGGTFADDSVAFTVNRYDSSGTLLWLNAVAISSLQNNYYNVTGAMRDRAGSVYAAGSYYNAGGSITLGSDVISGSAMFVGKFGIGLVAHTTLTISNCLGNVTTTMQGGVGPYTFAWSTGHTTPNAVGLPPGTHTLTIHDSSGLSLVKTIVVPRRRCIGPVITFPPIQFPRGN